MPSALAFAVQLRCLGRTASPIWPDLISDSHSTRTALVTAPFLFGTIPAFSAPQSDYFPLGLLPATRR
jgi:hypothetical protein